MRKREQLERLSVGSDVWGQWMRVTINRNTVYDGLGGGQWDVYWAGRGLLF